MSDFEDFDFRLVPKKRKELKFLNKIKGNREGKDIIPCIKRFKKIKKGRLFEEESNKKTLLFHSTINNKDLSDVSKKLF